MIFYLIFLPAVVLTGGIGILLKSASLVWLYGKVWRQSDRTVLSKKLLLLMATAYLMVVNGCISQPAGALVSISAPRHHLDSLFGVAFQAISTFALLDVCSRIARMYRSRSIS